MVRRSKYERIIAGLKRDRIEIIRRVSEMNTLKAHKHIEVMKQVDASILKWKKRFDDPTWS